MGAQAAAAYAVATKQFIVTCPYCESRMVVETLRSRHTGWRRWFPFGPRPVFACVGCLTLLDPGLPRNRTITSLRMGTLPLSSSDKGQSSSFALISAREAAEDPKPIVPPALSWEDEADIIQFRRRRRDKETLTRDQRRFRSLVIQELQRKDLEIPVMPQVAAQLSRLFRNSEINVARVIEVVQTDPMITATLLKLANSALYSAERPCESLKAAIERLGFAQVEGMVYSVTISCKVLTQLGFGYDPRKLHRHALGVAMLARLLAEKVGENGGQAFMGGVLHDVGKVVILGACRNVARRIRLQGLERVVHELIDLHHSRIGGVLCHRWELPGFLQEGLRCHHDCPPEAGVGKLAPILNLADGMAHVLGLGTPRVRVKIIAHPVLPILGLIPSEVEAVLEQFESIREDYEALARVV